MRIKTLLELGRVPNLPTVWTNVLAGMALAGFQQQWFIAIAACLAVSFIYLAGMFLNDAFDAKWDAQHKQSRPIVRGEITVTKVLWFSSGFIVIALALLWFVAPEQQKITTLIAALALIGAIVLYNALHKHWSHAAWIMGACRMLVYLLAASLFATPQLAVVLAGGALLVYIAGITYLARAEHLNQIHSFWPAVLLLCPSAFALFLCSNTNWDNYALLTTALTLVWILSAIGLLLPRQSGRNIPVAIGKLLAAMCLIDASLLVILGQTGLALFAVFAFALCIVLQKTFSAS